VIPDYIYILTTNRITPLYHTNCIGGWVIVV